MKKIIEIDLTKLERGTRTGKVRVHRGGKVFYREQRLGRKEHDEDKEAGAINKWIKDVIDPIVDNHEKLWDILENIGDSKNKETAEKYYNSLIDHQSYKVRGIIVNYLNDESLRQLMNDENMNVRYAVARKTNDPETIIYLAKDPDSSVRLNVIGKYYEVLLRKHSDDFLEGKDIEAADFRS